MAGMPSRKGKFRLDFSNLHSSKAKFPINTEIYTYVSYVCLIFWRICQATAVSNNTGPVKSTN